MAINLSDLPPKYQQQAVEKYMKQQKRRGACASRRRCAEYGQGGEISQHPHRAGHRLRGRSPL